MMIKFSLSEKVNLDNGKIVAFKKAFEDITKTGPCNMQRFLKAVKMVIFR